MKLPLQTHQNSLLTPQVHANPDVAEIDRLSFDNQSERITFSLPPILDNL